MKSFLIFVLTIIVMVAGKGVHVVDNNPGHVNVVDNNPGHVHVVDQPDQIVVANPDPAFYQGGQNGGVVITNPDPYFSQGGQGVGSGSRPKKFDDPYLRGGK